MYSIASITLSYSDNSCDSRDVVSCCVCVVGVSVTGVHWVWGDDVAGGAERLFWGQSLHQCLLRPRGHMADVPLGHPGHLLERLCLCPVLCNGHVDVGRSRRCTWSAVLLGFLLLNSCFRSLLKRRRSSVIVGLYSFTN